MNIIAREYMKSPVGILEICASENFIHSVAFVERKQKNKGNSLTAIAVTQLSEYFDGQRQDFNLPMKQEGTPFQQAVWQALLSIPYGTTCSYADIANQIGKPKAVRAVGAANGRNKLAIVIPCHRVVGANGTLTGYAGGLDRKEILLRLEGSLLI